MALKHSTSITTINGWRLTATKKDSKFKFVPCLINPKLKDGVMKYQRIEGCSLERMIGFIVEVNRIEKLQFILYLDIGKARDKQRLVEAGDTDIFIYGEHGERERGWQLFTPQAVGEAIHPDWLKGFERQFQKKEEENLALTSRVELAKGRIKHIPMVDFDCACSEQNFQKAIEALLALGEKGGFLLKSGKSYHYYGIGLLSETRWHNLMKRCQKQELIGYDWPLLQLRDGFSGLRVSTSSTKSHLPQLIAKIGDFEF